LYAARGGKKTIILGGDTLGGQMTTIHALENYPGWTGTGTALAEFMKTQAESFGAELVMETAAAVSKDGSGFRVQSSSNKEYVGKAVIVATGAKPRRLDAPGVREFTGRGVSYCATCDGFFYSGQTVVVIGGGNSALNDALYLADIAKDVKILYRRAAFARCEDILVSRVREKDNIEVLWETELASVGGDDSGVNHIITNRGGRIDCSGVFITIGHEANTDYLDESVARGEMGRLGPDALPSGMFVAGDVRAGLKMQIATAVGTGCEVAMDAIAFVNALG
jgi:thioredoxin reductase (NADPH)